MDTSVPKEGITGLLDKLSEKIFNENSSTSSTEHEIFKVRYNKRISGQMRNIVYCGLLSQEEYCGLERTLAERDKHLTVKDRLCVLGFNFKAVGLLDKFNKLDKMVSKLDFTSNQSSPFTGHLDAVHEVEAVLKVLLALANNSKMMTQDPCEVWRKVDSSSQSITAVQTAPSPFHSDTPKATTTSQFSLDYQFYPSALFEVVPCFGVPKRGFEQEDITKTLNIFSQEPGSCGLTKWFGAQRNKDSFCKKTRTTLYNALVHSQTHDFEVKLSLPDLPLHSHHRLYSKPLETPMISEDEGFVEVSDESEQSTTLDLSDGTGIQSLEVWDEALKQKPSCFYTWEGRKQIGFKSCKPFTTEAGPEVIDCVYDMRMKEASFLINAPSASFKYLEMKELSRDGLMVLIGVPSQTFQLEKSTTSFLISPRIRLSGCSPESLHRSLQGLADIGTNYLRLSKFTSYQKHSTMVQSSVLRAFIGGLRKYLQKYREAVIMVEAPRVQSALELSMKFRKQAHELKFLSDICMCPQAFAGAVGKHKPRFPVGVKLLSYIYQLCLINVSSPVANLLLFLLKVSCAPYLRFVQQWVFKGHCTDVYKEFMINKNDIYLANRDKHYWNSGYTMASNTKMEGVPVFLKDLAEDMFTCGKSINLLKLCFPAHYICNHGVGVPVMNVVYSLDFLKVICESSRRYCDEMRKLKQQKKMDWERKKNEEKLRKEQHLILEREKANKALAEVKELVQKAKKALAEKKKEELDFLKQQMEDALNRKLLDVKKVDEEDARVARVSSLYEVTTAKLEEQLKEEAREELIRYYDELTRVAERREEHALWLTRRHALKNEREKFLETETNKLEELRKEMKDKIDKALDEADEVEGAPVGVRRKQWAINAQQSTVQNLIYNPTSMSESHTRNSDKTLATSGRESKGAIRNPTESTIQNQMYPTDEQGFTSEKIKNRGTSGDDSLMGTSETGDASRSMSQGSSPYHQKSTEVRVAPKSTRGSVPPSTAEHLMYPSGDTDGNTTKSSRRGELPSTIEHIMYPSGDTDGNTTKSSRRGELPSTIEHIMYPSGDTDGNTTKSSRRGELPSTVEHLMYPSGDTDGNTTKSSRRGEPPSTVEHLMYPSGDTDGNTTKSSRRGELPSTIEHIMYPSGDTDGNTTKSSRRGEPPSTIEHLMYPSGDTDGNTTKFSRRGEPPSTAEHLMYPSGDTHGNTTKSSRRGEPPSTIEHIMYPSGDTHGNTTKFSRRGEPPSTVEHLMYPSGDTDGNTTKSSRRGEPPSTIEHLMYPSDDTDGNTTKFSRRREPPSTIEHIMYPSDDTNSVRLKSSRGIAPPTTIQKLLYPAPSATQEPEIQKREPLTHEDVWLATEFESYPDNFDILNEKPFGDIFARVLPDREGLRDDFYVCETEDEDLESENDACKVLCLPVILQRCVMEPLITQINVVNSAIVCYFMDDLKLIEHFETLKKFLLMEDGEFSFSLTQQLSEKVSSGVTPQQLCCISTLNSIMAQAIQSSVYACQSENTRSLSFVLKSLPDIFKRNDVGIFDFIQLRYKIQWPVNIVITENCITKYNRIFAFMLRLKRISWVLQDIRYSLKRVDKSARNSPQLRKVHLFRHEMSHFVNDVQGYISNQILHVTWQEFLQSLDQNVRKLDDIHDCHADYLNKALFRALLNKKAAPVMKIISDLFTMVLKFRTQLVSSSWFTDPASGRLVHPGFSLLCSTHESFKESTCFLLTVIGKLVTRGYQPHLEELLLRLDFNSYYGKE